MDNIMFKRVSPMDKQEIHDIYRILRACGEDMYNRYGLKHWFKPYKEEFIARDAGNKEVYIVSSENRNIATFTMTKEKSSYFDDDIPSIYIAKVATWPSEEGKGIGSKCISFIEAQAILSGIDRIRLDVYTKSENAIRFYQNKGFVIVDEKPTQNFSVYCMEKVL